MPPSRRAEKAEVRFGPALKAMILCLAIGTAAVGYVRQKNELWQLKGRFTRLDRDLRGLRQQTLHFERRLSELHTPRILEAEVLRHRLDLSPPRPGQVVTLPAALQATGRALAATGPGSPRP